MADRLVPSKYPTIKAAAAALAAGGDQIVLEPGSYYESLKFTSAKDLRIVSRDGPGTVKWDGRGLLDMAVNYQSGRKLEVLDIEVCNFHTHGVIANNPNVSGRTGTSAYNPKGVMNPRAFHHVAGCHVHNIGRGTLTSSGNSASFGIWSNAGHKPDLSDNFVHHVGDTNESIGIVVYYAYKACVNRNVIFGCRKECIRHGYGFQNRIDSNHLQQAWVGACSEYQVGAVASNNFIHDCDWGTYTKQSNNNVTANPRTRDFWGAALGKLGAYPSEPVAFIHNTVAACRFNWIGLATQYPQDNVHAANNLLIGMAHVDAAGVKRSMGDAFIQDVGSNALLTNTTVDHNTYVTDYGRPAWWLVKGQPNPPVEGKTGTASFKGLQAWRGLGWERNGQVVSVAFPDPEGRDFTLTTPITGGRDLTKNPVNPLGSPYGTQVGCDHSKLPTAPMKICYVGGPNGGPPTVVSVTSNSRTMARASDLRYLTNHMSAPKAGITGGKGVNHAAVLKVGTAVPVTDWVIGCQPATTNAAPKQLQLRYGNTPTGPWKTPAFTMPSWTGPTITFADGQQTEHIVQLKTPVTAPYWEIKTIDTWGDDQVALSTVQPLSVA